MRKLLLFAFALVVILNFLCTAGMGNAALTTIGTATYGSTNYNLIWDNDNTGNSLVWLNYTNGNWTNWTTQTTWTASLESSLTISLLTGYSVTWTDSTWRLPATWGGTEGYNITTSEMGHLFYIELGNPADYFSPFSPNTGIFENLLVQNYWSGTEHAGVGAYYFHMGGGSQNTHWKVSEIAGGMAVRSGDVSAVPIPGAVWLLGSWLLTMTGLRRKLRK